MVMSYGNSEEDSQDIPAVSCVLRRMARMPPMLLADRPDRSLLHHESRPGAEIKRARQ